MKVISLALCVFFFSKVSLAAFPRRTAISSLSSLARWKWAVNQPHTLKLMQSEMPAVEQIRICCRGVRTTALQVLVLCAAPHATGQG